MHFKVSKKVDGQLLNLAKEMLEQAHASISNAYAPYSNFQVGAAVVDDQGRVFTGVNIENASLGLTMCAERVAIFSAIATGARHIKAIAVTSEKVPTISPCGACRQVMAEFAKQDSPVFLGGTKVEFEVTSVGQLLPEAFTSDQLKEHT